MIFSVSSVCLAYVFGIVVFTLYIRSLAIVGAGFFWLMSSINIVLVFLSLISLSGGMKYVCFLVLICALFDFAYVIVARKQLKEKWTNIELVKSIVLLLAVAATLVAIVQRDLTGWDFVRESARMLVGGTLLGGVTTTMLLGHWYLVQPGLTRKPISHMCGACMGVLCADFALWLVPTSMISVFRGTISDGWGGTLGYMWLGSCVTTAALLYFARKALQEKSYSAVMATTGLLYLAILMANGVELIPRAIFS